MKAVTPDALYSPKEGVFGSFLFAIKSHSWEEGLALVYSLREYSPLW